MRVLWSQRKLLAAVPWNQPPRKHKQGKEKDQWVHEPYLMLVDYAWRCSSLTWWLLPLFHTRFPFYPRAWNRINGSLPSVPVPLYETTSLLLSTSTCYFGFDLQNKELLERAQAGTAERILKWGGGAENERRRRELVGGFGGMLPQKILKSRASEIVFTAFSARYFLK